MSHEEEKSASALASPAAEIPSLTAKAKTRSGKSSPEDAAERTFAADSQDEVNAFASDASWTEDEERALVWRLGALKKFFFDMPCC